MNKPKLDPQIEMVRGGIFGPSLGGKTTLAKSISAEYFSKKGMRTLVLDPIEDEWGKHSLAFTDEEKFWKAVWGSKSCLVVVDEATVTINRDKELIKVFTMMRHRGHILLVCGHSGINLLPIMREQLDTLYLFRQSREAVKIWRRDFRDDDAIEKVVLFKQYEFLKAEKWGAIQGPLILKFGKPNNSSPIKNSC